MSKRLSKEMKCIECGLEYTATYISGSKPRRRGIEQAQQANEFYLKRSVERCIAN